MLTAERDNLVAALRFAVDASDADTAVRLGAALGLHWLMQGSHAEGADWLRLALDIPGDVAPETRAIALTLYVINTASAGRVDGVPPVVDELRSLSASVGSESTHPVLALLEPGLAVFSDEPIWVRRLADVRFEPARGMLAVLSERGGRLGEAGANHVKRDRAPYQSGNPKEVLRLVDQYGPDFRNPFNHTPLMLAAAAGNTALVEALLGRGADVALADNHGRLAFDHVLVRAFTDAAYARGPFERLYAMLAPQAVDLMGDGRLLKLDAHVIEYFVFNALVALLQLRLNYPHGYRIGFRVDDLLTPADAFPQSIFPERRRRRAYLNGVLARN